MNKKNILNELTTLVKDIFKVTWTLFKIMVPIIVVLKICEEFGLITLIGQWMSPLMTLVGLPGETALVWATTIATGIYGGMVVFFSSPYAETLSVAQVSVLSGMMLIAHGLPIEGSIAKRTGVTWLVTLSLRLGGAMVYGALLNIIYQFGGWLQQPNKLLVSPPASSNSLGIWIVGQLEGLLWIFLIIAGLLSLLRLLRYLHIERLLAYLLKPLLKLLGIGTLATNITIIGLTLGLSYGGGLLIKEADSGELPKQDILATICLLGLSHSLIEDTILVLLLGAHISAVLWLKLLFSFITIAIFIRWANARSEVFRYRYLIK